MFKLQLEYIEQFDYLNVTPENPKGKSHGHMWVLSYTKGWRAGAVKFYVKPTKRQIRKQVKLWQVN
jgi:hypothetical protein